MDEIYVANYCVNQNYEIISFSDLINAALYIYKGSSGSYIWWHINEEYLSLQANQWFYNKVKLLN